MPDHPPSTIDRTRFAELYRQWAEETEFVSSTTRIAAHPACRELIALGEDILPLVLGELENPPTIQALVVLKGIVGSNPFPIESRGDLTRMTDAWRKSRVGLANPASPDPFC